MATRDPSADRMGQTIHVKTTSPHSIGTRSKGLAQTTLTRLDTSASASSGRSTPNEEVSTATSHAPSTTYPMTNGHDSPHKRKRSDSNEDERGSPHRQYDYSPPRRIEHPQHMADRALNVLDNDHAPPSYYSNGQPIHTNGHWTPDQTTPLSTSSDRNGMHEQSWSVTTPTNGQGYDQDGPINSATGLQKRKRNFANRTKTGCMTCRKRKKKCDEQRPFCTYFLPLLSSC